MRRRVADDDWDLTLGTDFSGMESVRMALQNLGYKVNQRFRCDLSSACRTLAAELFPDCGTTFVDISNRYFGDVPTTDLYVAGPPCPPWSQAGKKGGAGLQDPRGVLWKYSLAYVINQKPKAVIYECVKGLTFKQHVHVLTDILHILTEAGYVTWHRVLDTQDHGLPQHRERLYIVAVLRTILKSKVMDWPEPLGATVPLRTLLHGDAPVSPGIPPEPGRPLRLVRKAITEIMNKTPDLDLHQQSLVVDIGSSEHRLGYMINRWPTITAKRASEFGYWCVDLGRRVQLADLLKLQGISPSFPGLQECLRNKKVKEGRVAHMLGNSMSVNVMERLLPRVLYLINVAPSNQQPDRWANLFTTT